jgi:cystathionine gamma-synthase
MRPATRAIRVGSDPDAANGDVIPPIHLSTTFIQDEIGAPRGGHDYSRSSNPTREALERVLAALEGAHAATAFASGLAAEDALFRAILRPGDRVLLGDDAYGGTHRLLDRVYRPWGVELAVTDLTDTLEASDAIVRMRPKLIWTESPSNPLLRISDISALAQAARRVDAALVVDNTFATPVGQQPLALGATAVVHSTTKYVAGHSDALGGAVVTDDAALAERVSFLANATGASPGPFECYLTHRGIKTLAVRLERHAAAAGLLAERLTGHPAVARVYYPGLLTHPGHEVAARQQTNFGGMVGVELVGGELAARQFVLATRLFTLAESLGGVESLIELPAAMTHASVAGTALEVPPGFVRLSVGLEDPEDLWEDLSQALERTQPEGAQQ